jgi:hypothetical protein
VGAGQCHRARVAERDRFLCGICISLFADGNEFVALDNQASVSRRVGSAKSEYGDCSAFEPGSKRAQCLSAQQRRVAENDEEIAAMFDRLLGGEHSMRRAAALRLYINRRRWGDAAHLGGDIVPGRANHDRNTVGARTGDRTQHMRHERIPGNPVQDLGGRGSHARTFAGGEDNRGSKGHRYSWRGSSRERFSPWSPSLIAAMWKAQSLAKFAGV